MKSQFKDFSRFLFVPQYTYGIPSNMVNIQIRKSNQVVGYVEAKDVPKLAMNGDTSVFQPVEGWQATFSNELKTFFNLGE